MNYGEELAYWYLRFNGFFPLTNFVLHRDANNPDPSDCDLLAIRNPFVYEEVGGQEHDWDPRLKDLLNWNNKTVGLICEVKTGVIGEILPTNNIDRAVKRLGLVSDTVTVNECLAEQHTYLSPCSNFQISTLLIADQKRRRTSKTLFIPLSHTLNFLKQKIQSHYRIKNADRLFFNSSLMQQLIWQSERPHNGF
jgi:hypothetical protein